MSAFVNEVTDSNFEAEVLKSAQPVLVDFWAEWCGPCQRLAPTVESLAEQYQDKAKVVKLDVDQNNNSATSFGVRGIPTLILFRDGQEVERIVGVPSNPKAFISEMLDKHLSQNGDKANKSE